jgi:exopolyphosphatase/guanosine-5'-triphosphate,3'-diphosphate pyrophosphatase
MKVAVIDIGTLKVKFLISEIITSSKFKTKYQSNTLTCLGVKMHENNNRPLPQYLDQTINELKRCNNIIQKEKVDKIRIVSTHALREMGEVGQDIVEKIKNEVGLNVEIITQDEEANLFYQAVLKDFKTDKDFTIVDVGGGSVQILIGNKKALKEKYLLKTGAQYLFDHFSPRHTGNDFPTREEIRAMQDYIMKELTPIPKGIKTPVVYGSSCIINVFKKIGLNLEKYYISKAHPYRVKVSEMENFMENIISVPYDKREEMYKLDQQYYMWGIDKAFLNILSICKKEDSPFVIPSNSNINDGLVLSLIK